VRLTTTLTLQGGYTVTNWMTADPVANLTTLDAQGAGRVIYAPADASLQGFTATNGQVDGDGGGIYAAGALTLTRMAVTNSRANNFVIFAQNFDSLTMPALPAGWSTSYSGVGIGWQTDNTFSSSAPNSAVAFIPASTNMGATGESTLTTPPFFVGYNVQLMFRNMSYLKAGVNGTVLEIAHQQPADD
jgi:hypothetical protein